MRWHIFGAGGHHTGGVKTNNNTSIFTSAHTVSCCRASIIKCASHIDCIYPWVKTSIDIPHLIPMVSPGLLPLPTVPGKPSLFDNIVFLLEISVLCKKNREWTNEI